ncbi:MAG: cytochrome c-type biogenesis protein CcmH [Acidimicrobiia bacterium]|nr:cytochrome c-type biogenesis protein CcmH [Acidimicrobiia bacterium]
MSIGVLASRRHRQALSWAAALVVVVGALSVGTLTGAAPRTSDERAQSIWAEVGCPVCEGQSVAQSNAAVATAIRTEVRRQIDEGATDDQILDYLADRYGEEVLLTPRGEGIGVLVWALPVVAAAAAALALGFVFRRWRDDAPSASDDDRALVAAYLADDGGR